MQAKFILKPIIPHNFAIPHKVITDETHAKISQFRGGTKFCIYTRIWTNSKQFCYGWNSLSCNHNYQGFFFTPDISFAIARDKRLEYWYGGMPHFNRCRQTTMICGHVCWCIEQFGNALQAICDISMLMNDKKWNISYDILFKIITK